MEKECPANRQAWMLAPHAGGSLSVSVVPDGTWFSQAVNSALKRSAILLRALDSLRGTGGWQLTAMDLATPRRPDVQWG